MAFSWVLSRRSLALTSALVLCGSAWGAAPVAVTTGQYDVNRTGANLAEKTLTPSNVNKRHFGLLFSRSVDHYMYAQPLYVPNVIIPPATKAVNVVYVATLNNTV